MTTFSLAGIGFTFFGVERCHFKNDAFLRPRFDGCDVGVCADCDTFGL